MFNNIKRGRVEFKIALVFVVKIVCNYNSSIAWDNSKIITTNRCYHQRRCLEAWHINSTHAPLNCDNGGLLPDEYCISLIDDVTTQSRAVLRSPLRKTLDRSVETLGCEL